MCFDDIFRLCSCDADKLPEEDIGWELKVKDDSLPQNRKKGKRKGPDPLGKDDQESAANVLEQLNGDRSVFDFDLDPAKMYWVKIRIPGSKLHWFNYTRNANETKWCFVRQVSGFASWRPQMVVAAAGTMQPLLPTKKALPEGGGGQGGILASATSATSATAADGGKEGDATACVAGVAALSLGLEADVAGASGAGAASAGAACFQPLAGGKFAAASAAGGGGKQESKCGDSSSVA